MDSGSSRAEGGALIVRRDVAIVLTTAWVLSVFLTDTIVVMMHGWTGIADVFLLWSVLGLGLWWATARVTGLRVRSQLSVLLLVVWAVLIAAAISGVDHRATVVNFGLVVAVYVGFPIGVAASAGVLLWRRSRAYVPAAVHVD